MFPSKVNIHDIMRGQESKLSYTLYFMDFTFSTLKQQGKKSSSTSNDGCSLKYSESNSEELEMRTEALSARKSGLERLENFSVMTSLSNNE